MPTNLFAAGIPQSSARAVGCVAFAHPTLSQPPSPPPIRPAYGPSKWSPSPSLQPVQHTGPLPACPVLFFFFFVTLPVSCLAEESHCDDKTRQAEPQHETHLTCCECTKSGRCPFLRAHENQAVIEIIPFLVQRRENTFNPQQCPYVIPLLHQKWSAYTVLYMPRYVHTCEDMPT